MSTKEQLPVVQASELAAGKRKSVISRRFRVVTDEDRLKLKQKTIELHIERLENDNELEIDEENDEEYKVDDQEDMVYSTPKNKRKLNREREKKKSQVKNLSFPIVLERSYLETYPPNVPTYNTIASTPSIYPPRHFCSICGYIGDYSCKQCYSRYCSKKCFAVHNDNRCKTSLY
ncbi:hypothetical protein DFA_01824 [Cavenderia fasciculata]|uniref:HIT-type domain-containing protein n=1 Tax=Cavenderia fasciculata TaxID=261658 RepID=F4PUX6_CACFS|nr:uncharacterized protein DFA_01824 [Cavenderia fasciculata]EGG21938.1 hypothetical protein DFA_01824 [Cavenderia fasciculata]|eukprot:XP_004359789.1 hypothetical protein DFA_01824 [Cavenderia fasciculata]